MRDTSRTRADILGEPPPKAYRVFLLRKDGGVIGTVPVSAQDDDQAIGRAKALVDGNAVDLWDGLRFIEHFAPIG